MTEIDANDLTAPGWDQASDGFAAPADHNPHRLRLWQVSRRVTFVVAGLQLLPLIALFAGDILPSESSSVASLVAISVVMALQPWLLTNLFNLFYPLLLCIIYWMSLGGLRLADFTGLMDITTRFLSGLFYGLEGGDTWELWVLRITMLAATGQIAYKLVRMWNASPADRDAIRIWWRRPQTVQPRQDWA